MTNDVSTKKGMKFSEPENFNDTKRIIRLDVHDTFQLIKSFNECYRTPLKLRKFFQSRL